MRAGHDLDRALKHLLAEASSAVAPRGGERGGRGSIELAADALVTAASLVTAETRGLPPRTFRGPLSTDERRALDAVRALVERSPVVCDEDAIGRLYELSLDALDALRGSAMSQRRRSGKHYTPRALADEVTEETLAPLLRRASNEAELSLLRVCDPAMGSGAFVLAAARAIALALTRVGVAEAVARSRAIRCLRGVDLDAGAVRVTKLCAYLFAGDPALSEPLLDRLFVTGDALAAPLVARSGRPSLQSYFAEKKADLPVALDWSSAFADVFARARPGFDAVVGNPPFVGGKRIATALGPAYAGWLREVHSGANGNVDLSGHFLRRAFDLVRLGGRVGFITTNTIAQGDTRAGSLAHVCAHGGVITHARPRVPWPGDAAVVVSVVHVERDEGLEPTREVKLDGRPVRSIDAFLREGDAHRDPVRLDTRRDIAFVGCFLRGMGFTFDDASPDASPLAEMRRILALRPSSQSAIRPYLGGEEVNTSPTHAHHRYAIDLYPFDEDEARRRHPELVEVLERKVRPHREGLGDGGADRAHKARWWRFANDRPELRGKLASLERMFVVPRVSSHWSVVPMSARMLCSEQLVVVALEGWDAFAILSSRVHETWARRHSSTLGDGLRYTPSDSFETFPFPPSTPELCELGEAYATHRARLLASTGAGLTATWRRFHDPSDEHEAIVTLRRLHDAIDRAVLDAYGDRDLSIDAAFRPRHTRTKRSHRYAWSDVLTREVLERLARRNAEEARKQGGSRAVER